MSITIALAGNPNSGKTTLFNALTGATQYVGNWPGVTVEKKSGSLKGQKDVRIEDLPGIYSLSPYTMEEVISRRWLVTRKPDAIINIVDGTNLERNLYLTTQVMELGIPVVIAVNMMDVVRKNGDRIDTAKLSKAFGTPVVEISALKGDGIQNVVSKAIDMAKKNAAGPKPAVFSDDVESAIAEIEAKLPGDIEQQQKRYFAIKLLERDDKVGDVLSSVPDVESTIKALEEKMDDDTESIITNERYNVIESVVKDSYTKKHTGETISDKIDKVVTNRWLALPIFALIMWGVYYLSIQTVGDFATGWTNDVLFGEWIPGAVTRGLEAINCHPVLMSLIVDGIIGGVGAVLGFVPQMIVLFLCLAFLEECGYMARVAFIMDRIFRRFGLSGKSFIPILIGTGCGIPGVMASRTIESERDRRMTVMTTTFIPCGAKLPIIALIAGAFFPDTSWVAPSAYFVGIAAIVCSGIILKKTKRFAGDPAPFVMELPAYHWPTVGSVLRSVWERAWSFIKKAGTIILLSTIVLWFLMNFGVVDGHFGMLDFEGLEGAALEQMQANAILAKIGSAIAFIFRPLGFGNWRFSVAAVTGLIAKENVVATLGMLFGYAEVAEDGAEYWGAIRATIAPAAAYSYLLFNLLCAPCFAAIGAIRREMNDMSWTWYAIGWQCGLAYAVSLVVYQFWTHTSVIGMIVAVLLLILFLYLLLRPNRQSKKLQVGEIKLGKATA